MWIYCPRGLSPIIDITCGTYTQGPCAFPNLQGFPNAPRTAYPGAHSPLGPTWVQLFLSTSHICVGGDDELVGLLISFVICCFWHSQILEEGLGWSHSATHSFRLFVPLLSLGWAVRVVVVTSGLLVVWSECRDRGVGKWSLAPDRWDHSLNLLDLLI